MAKGSSGTIYPDPFNEVDNKDPNKPDVDGEELYFNGWSEINKMHLAETGGMVETPNSKASREVYGGPAKGEPQADMHSGRGGK